MKRSLLLFFSVFLLFLVLGCQIDPQEAHIENQIRDAENPYRIVLTVTDDLRTSIAINFELPDDVPGFVEYREVGEGPFLRQVTEEKTTHFPTAEVYHRKTELTGLVPGTEYEYRVVGTQISDIYRFRTVSEDPESISLVLLSDPQGSDKVDYMTYSNNLIRVIERYGKRLDLAIYTGDIVNDDDSRIQWNLFFRYSSVLTFSTPVAAAIGNHETGSFTDIQIQSTEFEGYFNFPRSGPVYSSFDALENDRRLPHFDLGKTYSFDLEAAHFVAVDSEIFVGKGGIDGTLDEENVDLFLEWLENDLAPHKDGWIILFLHRGPYSLHYDSRNVRERLVPILDRNHVDLVLSGHDHRYSRSVYQDDELIPFAFSDEYSRGTPHLEVDPLSSLGHHLNDYSASLGTTYVVGNSSSVKFYDPSQDVDRDVSFQYDGKNPVIPIVEITDSAITFTAYVIERSDDFAFFPDTVSVLENFIIRP